MSHGRQSGKDKSQRPMISIIVPVYRSEPYLEQCIRTVLEQTFQDFELILVDDGSPDRCPEMCDMWRERDSRIRVIHQPHGGAASARNRGLEAASGRYIGFVDSDDWIDRDMYHVLYQAVTERQADMAVCGVSAERKHRVPGREGTRIRKGTSGRTEEWGRKDLLDRFFRVKGGSDPHSIWNCLIRAERVEGYRFPEGKMNEDIDLSYHLAVKCGRAVSVPGRYYHYYRNRDSVTNGRFTMKRMDLLDIWERIGERVPRESPEYTEAYRLNRERARFTLLAQMALCGYDRRDPEVRMVKKKLKAEVRAAYQELMRWKMPFSRKVLLTLLVL